MSRFAGRTQDYPGKKHTIGMFLRNFQVKNCIFLDLLTSAFWDDLITFKKIIVEIYSSLFQYNYRI